MPSALRQRFKSGHYPARLYRNHSWPRGYGEYPAWVPISFRIATPDDYADFARLYPELDAPEPVPPEAWFHDQAPRVLLACDGDRVVAYAYWLTYASRAHVSHVVVDRSRRRCGVGLSLMEELRARLAAAGCVDWYLHVRRGNEAARLLYERCGLRQEWTAWALEWDVARGALPPASSGEPNTVFAPTADDDEWIEDALGIDRGRLCVLRARGEISRALRSADGAIVGFAALDRQAGRVDALRAADSCQAAMLSSHCIRSFDQTPST